MSSPAALLLLLLPATVPLPSNSPDQGLYGISSKVHILDSSNINTLAGTSNCWLVEFYNFWCGHCQSYAPVWESLAERINGWQSIIRVAALDCAREHHGSLCADYEVNYYPALKFFSAKSDASSHGLEMAKQPTVHTMIKVVAQLVRKEQAEGRGATWPDITVYNFATVDELWSNIPESVKYLVIVFEPEDSPVGIDLVLGFSSLDEVCVRSVSPDQEEALTSKSPSSSSPSLYSMDKNGNVTPLMLSAPTSFGYREAVQQFLMSVDIYVTEIASTTTTQTLQYSVAVSASLDIVVYQVDLEKTLMYSLKHEVPAKAQLSHNAVSALKEYVRVLHRYFPTHNKGREFLKVLEQKLAHMNSLKGQMFADLVLSLEEKGPVFEDADEWLGCRGSSPRYRGYPCGLWTMFHTLTVNAMLQNVQRSSSQNNREVLNAMLGYITHFFGCEECSVHFQKMASDSMHTIGNGTCDGILWLWRAHNKVNQRLSGDMTEDPEHPKIQFPPAAACPECRDADGQLVGEEVLKFLKDMYQRDAINLTGWHADFAPAMRAAHSDMHPSSSSPGPYLGSAVSVVILASSAILFLVLVAAFPFF